MPTDATILEILDTPELTDENIATLYAMSTEQRSSLTKHLQSKEDIKWWEGNIATHRLLALLLHYNEATHIKAIVRNYSITAETWNAALEIQSIPAIQCLVQETYHPTCFYPSYYPTKHARLYKRTLAFFEKQYLKEQGFETQKSTARLILRLMTKTESHSFHEHLPLITGRYCTVIAATARNLRYKWAIPELTARVRELKDCTDINQAINALRHVDIEDLRLPIDVKEHLIRRFLQNNLNKHPEAFKTLSRLVSKPIPDTTIEIFREELSQYVFTGAALEPSSPEGMRWYDLLIHTIDRQDVRLATCLTKSTPDGTGLLTDKDTLVTWLYALVGKDRDPTIEQIDWFVIKAVSIKPELLTKKYHLNDYKHILALFETEYINQQVYETRKRDETSDQSAARLEAELILRREQTRTAKLILEFMTGAESFSAFDLPRITGQHYCTMIAATARTNPKYKWAIPELNKRELEGCTDIRQAMTILQHAHIEELGLSTSTIERLIRMFLQHNLNSNAFEILSRLVSVPIPDTTIDIFREELSQYVFTGTPLKRAQAEVIRWHSLLVHTINRQDEKLTVCLIKSIPGDTLLTDNHPLIGWLYHSVDTGGHGHPTREQIDWFAITAVKIKPELLTERDSSRQTGLDWIANRGNIATFNEASTIIKQKKLALSELTETDDGHHTLLDQVIHRVCEDSKLPQGQQHPEEDRMKTLIQFIGPKEIRNMLFRNQQKTFELLKPQQSSGEGDEDNEATKAAMGRMSATLVSITPIPNVKGLDHSHPIKDAARKQFKFLQAVLIVADRLKTGKSATLKKPLPLELWHHVLTQRVLGTEGVCRARMITPPKREDTASTDSGVESANSFKTLP